MCGRLTANLVGALIGKTWPCGLSFHPIIYIYNKEALTHMHIRVPHWSMLITFMLWSHESATL